MSAFRPLSVVYFAAICLPFVPATAALADEAVPPGGIAGIWEGPLKVGPFEHLVVFRIKQQADGSLTGTADIIDHGAKDLPCGNVTFADGKLVIEMPAFQGRYDAKLSDDGKQLAGRWKQGGLTLRMSLERVEKVTELRRPQHPAKPYPYSHEDITFENAAAKITLAGTLTLPRGKGPFPAVVLVSGSGPQDRDETVFLHKPFLVLADHLTRKGIAVLRFDDRGIGESGGVWKGSTSADFATDAYAALRYLQGRPEIDRRRIGIAGHSEGGWMAEMAAADHPDDVAFIILLGSTGVSGESIALAQAEDFATKLGASKGAVELELKFAKVLVAAIKAPGPSDQQVERITQAARDLEAGLSDKERKLVGTDKDQEFWKAGVDRWSDPWLRFSIQYDPAAVLRKVRCPVLAMIGEKDVQVRPDENLAAIAAALAAGGNERATIKEMPGLNHLFQTTTTGLPAEYARLEETFSPLALEAISAWILATNSP